MTAKSKVAVIRTQPETVLQDYQRLFEVAGGKKALRSDVTTIIKDNISWHFPMPAANTTPWQLEGAIQALRKNGLADLVCVENETVVTGNRVAVSKELVPLKHIGITNEQLAWAKKIMKKVEKEGMPPLQKDGIPDAMYAKDWIGMHEVQDGVDSLEVMVVRIGDVAFVGLNSEVFAEFGMDIKSGSPFKNTIVTGLTNDSRGYFPTKVSFTQGPKGFTPMITGYETTPGSTYFEIGSGEKMAESAVEQLKRIF